MVTSSNKCGIIIDPGADLDKILKYIKNNNITIRAIINTHAHYDHVGAIEELKIIFKIPLFMHKNDEKLLRSANLYAKIFDGTGHIKIPTIDYYFDKSSIDDHLSEIGIQILHSPGHTSGSVCILMGKNLFTGDTLFNLNIGRTDLPGGDENILNDSLKKLAELPPEIKIFPGHGKDSTIGYELKHNRHFRKALGWD